MSERFKVGDLVKIVANRVRHKFEIGETVRITNNHYTDSSYAAERLDSSDWWCVCEDDIAPVAEAK